MSANTTNENEVDPLSVPVAEATPAQLDAQAQFHAMNAAREILAMFLTDTPEARVLIEEFGQLVVMSIDSTELTAPRHLMMMVPIGELTPELTPERRLVYFELSPDDSASGTDVRKGIGVIDGRQDTIFEYPLDLILQCDGVPLAVLRGKGDMDLCLAEVFLRKTLRGNLTVLS